MGNTLEDALARIEELESENKKLRAELEVYAAWNASYKDFIIKYEKGMSIMEIVAEGNISRRTAYRYKAYYEELRERQDDKRQ